MSMRVVVHTCAYEYARQLCVGTCLYEYACGCAHVCVCVYVCV
jgi:hypothetical protein